VNIINAITDKNLFRPFLQDGKGRLSTWQNWGVALRCLYGLKIKSKHSQLVKECTGRSINQLPKNGFSTALLLVGRRGGKSKIAGLVAAFEAALSGKEKNLSPGETALVSVVSPTRLQSRIIRNYVRAALNSPLLEAEIIGEDKDGFLLKNKVRIQVLTGDFRSVRGFTQIAIVIDEICFMGLTEESKVKNDSELIQAIRPALITTKGKLIAISTKYAKKGWAYKTWKTNFGNEDGRVLVLDAPSRTMNPTLSQEDIDEAIAEDPIAGRTEFLNQWREDICIFLPREVIESVVKKNRLELLPKLGVRYYAFVDVSGGRNDSSAIAIGHKEEKVVVDYSKEYKSPHNPHWVIGQMSATLNKFKIRKVTGDNYSAEFCASTFKSQGFAYEKCRLPKSQLYLELIPTICSGGIELLDDETSIGQLAALERRTRSGGKDSVDHPAGAKDDVANVIAGLSFITSKRRMRVGAI
jgi:hypothetical protein